MQPLKQADNIWANAKGDAAQHPYLQARRPQPPNPEDIAAAAYSQFGIVAEDTEIVAFARWVLEQHGHQQLIAAARATNNAHESLFAQAASNPIKNAWGQQIFMNAVNDAKQLADAALKAAGAAPSAWWWLSFVDPARAPGTQFLGAVALEVPNNVDPIVHAHAVGVNPGGEVAFVFMEPERVAAIPHNMRNRLLTKEEAKSI